MKKQKWMPWSAVRQSGEYWFWRGDVDVAPVPVTVGRCHDGVMFGQMGQLGWVMPQMLATDLQGFWKRIPDEQYPSPVELARLGFTIRDGVAREDKEDAQIVLRNARDNSRRAKAAGDVPRVSAVRSNGRKRAAVR